jgi:hypothetical protein
MWDDQFISRAVQRKVKVKKKDFVLFWEGGANVFKRNRSMVEVVPGIYGQLLTEI